MSRTDHKLGRTDSRKKILLMNWKAKLLTDNSRNSEDQKKVLPLVFGTKAVKAVQLPNIFGVIPCLSDRTVSWWI